MIQFIKGPWKSGEQLIAPRLAPDFELVKTGKGFFKVMGDRLPEDARRTLQSASVIGRTFDVSSPAWPKPPVAHGCKMDSCGSWQWFFWPPPAVAEHRRSLQRRSRRREW